VLTVDLTDGVRHAEVQVQFRAGGSRTLFLLWDYRGGRRGQRVVYTGTAPLGVPHEDGTRMDDLATALRSLGRRFPFDLRDYRGDADVRTAYADLHAQLEAEMAQRLAAG